APSPVGTCGAPSNAPAMQSLTKSALPDPNAPNPSSKKAISAPIATSRSGRSRIRALRALGNGFFLRLFYEITARLLTLSPSNTSPPIRRAAPRSQGRPKLHAIAQTGPATGCPPLSPQPIPSAPAERLAAASRLPAKSPSTQSSAPRTAPPVLQ